MPAKKGFCLLPLDKLLKAEWNYKTEDPFMSERLLKNIQRRGQVQNLIVRECPKGLFEIANGNHRLDALKIAAIDPAVCFNLGQVTEEEAIRLAIETNETYFPIDPLKLGQRLKDLSGLHNGSFKKLAATLPYTEDEIGRYTALLDVDWEQLTPRSPAPTSPTKKGHSPTTIQVHLTPQQYQAWQEWRLRVSKEQGTEDDPSALAALIEHGLSQAQ